MVVKIRFLGGVILLLVNLSFVTAFSFNGTVYDLSGVALNNTVINVTVRSVTDFSIVGYNFTTTNESGWFNMTVDENAQWMYGPVITHKNSTLSYPDYVGQNLPVFPAQVYSDIGVTSFYLRDGGTINITAINSSANRVMFNYQIKDTKLGYPIAQSMGSGETVLEAKVIVPRDRNYSILIFPNQSLPISFDWNNFSAATSSYTIIDNTAGNISKYNVTTRTLHKQFNITLSTPRVLGFINASNSSSVAGWDEFRVVPFALEPGNMIHATYGAMPYNLSAFLSSTDDYNLTSGFFNLTLPASAEGVDYILFASGRNGSLYFGGVVNLTLLYGASDVRINITMYGLLGRPSNFSISNAANMAAKVNVVTAKQSFQMINSSNHSIKQAFVHAEISVNYSQYAAVPEFTWTEDVPQESSSNFSLALLNITGIKEMNLFVGGGNYAPKRLAPSIAQILNDNNKSGNVSNVSIGSFNPQAIDSQLQASKISMALYTSNASCDIPDAATNCLLGGGAEKDMSTFNPMSAIIGGGKLSFRMGVGNVKVHYANVDMIASGPPDALFDDSTRNGSSGGDFSAALRFGSGGPTIYDYVLVSVPYSETSGTGLNETAPVNISIPVFYDDDWNVIWNASVNGTNATRLGGNNSHYINKQADWQYLMNNVTCTTNSSIFNSSNPCYINTTANQIWIRLPHFSGTGPNVKGSTLPAASSGSSAASSSGGSSFLSLFWINTFLEDKKELKDIGNVNRELKERQRVRIKIDNEKHYVGIIGLTSTSATVNVSSSSQQAILNVGDQKKFDVTSDGSYDLLISLKNIMNNSANLTISHINEKIELKTSPEEKKNEASGDERKETVSSDIESGEEKAKTSSVLIWIIAVIFLIMALVYYSWMRKSKG